jgi:hypothetical protein
MFAEKKTETEHADSVNPSTKSDHPHPLVSGFACPSCAGEKARLATVLEWFLYLRCDACDHIWSHPERRQKQRRSVLPERAKPLNAELPSRGSERREG